MSQTDVDSSFFTYKTAIAGQTFRGELFDSCSTDEWKTSIFCRGAVNISTTRCQCFTPIKPSLPPGARRVLIFSASRSLEIWRRTVGLKRIL